jgi:YD repeat-containing protein
MRPVTRGRKAVTPSSTTRNNLTQLRTVTSTGQTLIRTRYVYDDPPNNRLIQVITDLSPEDARVADAKTYVVSYTYDGASKRIAKLTQTDGTSLTFSYVQVGADFRVQTITDALNNVTRFAYTPSTQSLRRAQRQQRVL